jgi:diguanylate cyclase (GGDEF)-like protein
MHDSARILLQMRQQGLPISSTDYNTFIDQSIDFKLKVRELQHEIIQQVCIVDPLTGVWNRQAMTLRLEQERQRIIRNNSHCAICMLDIDHFKSVNDQHGHTTGDQVLRKTIERCTDKLRSYDSIFRYGGEEFLICMPELGAADAEIIIERLRQHIAAESFELGNGLCIDVTASFGITQMDRNKSLEDTIIEADHALLCAKSKGRNCVCSWNS